MIRIVSLWVVLFCLAIRAVPADGPSSAIAVAVEFDGRRVLPAAGSASGSWFYGDRPGGPQLLLNGHAEVPGGWRLTAVLPLGASIRLLFPSNAVDTARLGHRVDAGDAAEKRVRIVAEPGALRLDSLPGEAGAGAARVLRWSAISWNGAPASFAPVRRPFSREPVAGSPRFHDAIAEALVEWDWRMQDGIGTPREPRNYREASERLKERMGTLVEERRRRGTLSGEEFEAWESWRGRPVPPSTDAEAGERYWLEAHRLRRRLLVDQPEFRMSSLLFLKHVPSVMSHQLTQMYGYCSRPGGGVFELDAPGRGTRMEVRDLTPPSLAPGNFMTPEVSYDGRHVLFAYCPVKVAPESWDFDERTRDLRYHLYELDRHTGEVHALTAGEADDFSPVLLPGGDVLFVSTRRGGFHRCGRGPCFVYTLARMARDGGQPRSISFHETHEWDPSLMSDGRVVYTRWDYVDRNAVHYQQLWATNPDGTATQILFGNNTWNPTGIWEARAIPGSTRLMATAGPHHGMSAGSIVLLDPSRGVDGDEPLTRLTPEVRFPESEAPLAFGPKPGDAEFDAPVKQHWRVPLTVSSARTEATEEERRWPGHCYKSPWPLSETCFVVSYSYDRLVGEPGPNIPNMFGVYFADAFGNRELVYRDPAISSLWARPLAPREPPPKLAEASVAGVAGDKEGGTGTFFVRDIGRSWPYLPKESRIAELRVVQVLLKTTPHADQPRVGAAFAAPGKQVLGTVPVEADGSAWFEVPARTPVLFQALDAEGRAVQTMRSLVYLQPGEQRSCVGCHEDRLTTATAERPVPALALGRTPSKLKPGPDGSRPFSYPRLVQPVLDRHCVRCHDGRDPKRTVLTGEVEGVFTKSYQALISRVAFSAWGRPENNAEPLTEPLRFGTLASPLRTYLERAHCETELSAEERERMYTWMDANALFYGTFDVAEQRRQLAGEAIPGPRE